MITKSRTYLLSSLFVCCVMTRVGAADLIDARWDNWHQWRGPLACGIAPHGDPPIRWSETENIRWKVKITGNGSSTPIVYGDQVFLLTTIKTDRTASAPPVPRRVPQPDGPHGERPQLQPDPTHVVRFIVLCLDRQTGKVRWQRTATEQVPHRGHHRDHGYASGSPTTDGLRLYASFGSQGVFGYDLDGNLLWSRDLGKMETYSDFGEAVTPVVHRDTLVVVHDHLGQSTVFALDAKTGQTKWKRDRDEQAGWSTPLIVERDGTSQVICAGANRIRSYDLATGHVVWQCGGLALATVPSPVVADNHVLCMTGYPQSALLAVGLDATGDITDTDKVVWQRDRDTSYVPSALIVGDVMYFTKMNSPVLTAVNVRTGETIVSAHRLGGLAGNIYASPVAAAGRIYITARGGATSVLRHGDQLEPLALNQLDDNIDASPAIVGSQIFVRGKHHLYCIEKP